RAPERTRETPRRLPSWPDRGSTRGGRERLAQPGPPSSAVPQDCFVTRHLLAALAPTASRVAGATATAFAGRGPTRPPCAYPVRAGRKSPCPRRPEPCPGRPSLESPSSPRTTPVPLHAAR